MASPQAAVWEAVLDDLRQTNEAVFIETDPATNVITQVLLPQSVAVAGIAAAPAGGRHEVDLEVSQARHHLDPAGANYRALLDALTVARQQGIQVLVTESLDDHEIIDVRPDLVAVTC